MSLFDEIYQAASNLEEDKLKQFLKSNLTLNVMNENGYVVEQLASENKHKAVDLLISLGEQGINAACRGYARTGYRDKVFALLAKGASKDWAVYGAARGGQKEFVTELLAKGSSINEAVYGAAFGGEKELVTELLAKGASKDWAVNGAARGGLKELVTELLAKGASINEAVCGAARCGQKELVTELLAKGASKDWAVNGAARGGLKELVTELLAKGASQDWAVYGAAFGGEKELVTELLAKGASINEAVCGAARCGQKELVTELLAKGASKDRAVYGAARGGNKELVTELLAKGASINEAVCGAARGGNKELVTELLAKGASINEAVCGAARCGQKELVTELLAKGASKDRAVYGAARGGNKELVTELLAKGASKDSAVRAAVEGGQQDLEKWIIANADRIKQEGLTAELKAQALATQPGWEIALNKLATMHRQGVPSATAAFLEVGDVHAKRAEALLKLVGEFDEDGAAGLVLLQKLVAWGVPYAVQSIDGYQNQKARTLLQAACKQDRTALAALERMAKNIGIAQLCLGQYYFMQIQEQAAPASQSRITALFKPTPPETLAIQAFNNALKNGLRDAHYHLGMCYEKTSQLSEALNHYFFAKQAGVMGDETQLKFKQLSAHKQAKIAVAANLYQWFLNPDQMILDAAMQISAIEVVLFAVEHSQDAALLSQHRLSLLLSLLTKTIPATSQQKIQEAIFKVIAVAMKSKADDAYELAKTMNQLLKQHSEQRRTLVMRLALSWDKYPEILRGALLHFEMREAHNSEQQSQLNMCWNKIPNAMKANFASLDVKLSGKKEEVVSTGATSSSSQATESASSSSASTSEEYAQRSATPAQQAAQFGQFKVTESNVVEKAEDQRALANGNADHQTASTSDYRNQKNADVATTVSASTALSLESLPNVPLHEDELLHEDEFPHPPEGEPNGLQEIAAAQSSM